MKIQSISTPGSPAPFLPLKGVKIVEFLGMGPAPYAAMLLADMGASVTCVARPGWQGSSSQISLRGRADVVEADLKDAKDVSRVASLLEDADALIEGFRPGVMERLGLGPATVHQIAPRICYGRVTGWGQSGPLAGNAGHDVNYLAIAGALHVVGPRQHPSIPANMLGDFAAGSLFLVCGLLAALHAARSTGKGSIVDAAMCDGAVSLMTAIHGMYAAGRWDDERESNLLDGGAPHYSTYACADGRFVSIAALEPQFFAELCNALGLGEIATEWRDDRRNWPALRARLRQVFLTRTRDEWSAVLLGREVCFAPVLSIEESFADAHLAARRAFVTRDGVRQSAPVPRFFPAGEASHVLQPRDAQQSQSESSVK